VRRALPAAVALALLVASVPARAADPARERERAALYKEGVDLAAAAKWADAVERFRRVIQIRASPKAMYTLGEAEEHAGQLAEARRSYRASLDAARAASQADVVDLAGQALGKVESRVPQITVKLEGKTAAHGGDLRASIDGRAAPVGAATDVDPGDHEVRVEATGAASPFVRVVHAVEGQQQEVEASLAWPAPAAPPPPAPVLASPAAERPRPSPVVLIVIGGVGLAAGIAGLVLRLTGQSDYDGAAGQCTSARVCPSASVASTGNDARERMITGTALLGAGAAVVVGAGVYWFLSAHPTSSALQVGAAVDGAGARAVLRASF
jgi:hypothetical protein